MKKLKVLVLVLGFALVPFLPAKQANALPLEGPCGMIDMLGYPGNPIWFSMCYDWMAYNNMPIPGGDDGHWGWI